MQGFWDLAAELIRLQPLALPNFRSEIDPILKKALPRFAAEELEGLKDYFITRNEAGSEADLKKKEPSIPVPKTDR